jgi:hypothetical protein
MMRTSLHVLAVLVILSLTSLPAAADEKKDRPALSGVWAQKGGLKITFDKETFKVSPHGDNEVVVLVCKYTLEKGGLVKAKLTDIEAADDIKAKVREMVPEGLEFTFKWQAKDGTATLEDLTGENTDAIKARMEGEYTKKKDD